MRAFLTFALLPMLYVLPAQAQPAQPLDPVVIEALTQLRADDVRVATIAYGIATASAEICPVTQPLTGMVVHDLSQYTDRFRDGAVRLFGADRGIAVEGVVSGSPADRAGLKPNDLLVAIDTVGLDRLPGSKDHMPSVRAWIDQAMADGKAVVRLVRDGRPMTIALDGVKGCASQIEIRPSEEFNGWADGTTAQLSSAMVDFTRDDDELATVIAHEMAHNILRHRARLNAAGLQRGLLARFGRNARLVRQTEIEADRLAVYLIARAGHDPHAATRFWDRLLDQHGPGIIADGTHLGRSKQMALVEGVAREVDALRAAGQPLVPPLLKGPPPPLD